jgi:hypothetical protein
MISVVITIIVIVLYKVYITNKQNNTKLKQLEEMLDRYYKEREQRLKDNELIK